MSDRRFTDKADLDPTAVRSLPFDHPALTGNRTLFPSTVVEVTQDAPDRILVSGHSNRKIGETVEKGRFKGYGLFCLSLEERATCPTDCGARAFCFGNGMQMARRHRIGDPEVFYDRLALEIVDLLDEHPGLLIRLHVLGDFPSVEYVAFWKEVLDEHPNVVCWGYTHRVTTAWGGDEIGDAIEATKDAHPERFRIRWSSPVSRPDGAVVINRVPDKPRVEEGIVCPAQTDATACCATCGLCWEAPTECIAFIKHGPKSFEAALQHEQGKATSAPLALVGGDVRRVTKIDMAVKVKPGDIPSAVPETRMVAPTDLLIEAAYQRDLTAKSIRLIRSIVAAWDWAKFKPPVCAETTDGLFVIDGQHTAIAAATHPQIKAIPVLVIKFTALDRRAGAFVSHNRDRITMSPLQVFHAEVTAGDKEALGVLRCAAEADVTIPRSPPQKGAEKPRQLTAITAVRRTYSAAGAKVITRILKIAADAGLTPIASTVVYGLHIVLREPRFAAVAACSDAEIARAIASIPRFEASAQAKASETGQNRYRAAAVLIAEATKIKIGEAA